MILEWHPLQGGMSKQTQGISTFQLCIDSCLTQVQSSVIDGERTLLKIPCAIFNFWKQKETGVSMRLFCFLTTIFPNCSEVHGNGLNIHMQVQIN